MLSVQLTYLAIVVKSVFWQH